MTATAGTLIGVLAAATTFALSAPIHAQPLAPPNVSQPAAPPPVGGFWDATQLPEARGVVKQYTLTPRGDVDGLILTDGTEVKIPPHLSAQLVFAVRPGDAVAIRGLKARALPLLEASSVTNFATRATVVDDGPPGPGPGGTVETINGRIVAQLHGPRGDVNGALVDNGTVLRLPPPEAERLQGVIQPGQPVAARGAVLRTVLGTVMEVTAIGSSPDQLTDVTNAPLPGPRPGPGLGSGGPRPR